VVAVVPLELRVGEVDDRVGVLALLVVVVDLGGQQILRLIRGGLIERHARCDGRSDTERRYRCREQAQDDERGLRHGGTSLSSGRASTRLQSLWRSSGSRSGRRSRCQQFGTSHRPGIARVTHMLTTPPPSGGDGCSHHERNSPLTPRRRARDNARVAETGARRVVVVEDHPIFRDGVVQCLDAEPDFAVVGQWASGDVDLVALGALAPDLVLMDVELPVISGIEATRRIRAALTDVRVVMLTAYAEPDLLFAAMQVGASGYLLKHTPAAELVATLRRIAGGEPVLTPGGAAPMLRDFRPRRASSAPHPPPPLSGREEEVLKLLA